MPRNKSAGSKRVHAELEDAGGGTSVKTTVVSGARAGLLRSSHCLIPFFKKAADVAGVYVWVASLYANHYVLKQLGSAALVVLSDSSKASRWKTFFDQILSALTGEAVARNHHNLDVKSFLKQQGGALHNDDNAKATARWVLPAPLPFQMRDNACAEMGRAAVMHLEGKKGGGGFLQKRTYTHLRCVLADAQARNGIIDPAVGKGSLISVMLKVVKGDAGLEHLQALAANANTATAAFEIAMAERHALTAYLGDRDLLSALPHAQRYSLWAERWAGLRHIQPGDAADVVTQKKAHLLIWTDAAVKLPQPFSILPVQKLQRRLVQYEATALAALFCDWIPEQTDAITQPDGALEAGRYEPINKDALDDLEFAAVYQEGRLRKGERKRALKGPSSAAADHALHELHLQRDRESMIFAQVVRVAHFKGKKRAEWVPVRISTDGIKLCVTYESATHQKAANLDALSDKGYDWSAPRARVDGSTPSLRGVYRDHQWRHDLYIPKDQSGFEIVAIDPGVRVKVMAASAPLHVCGDVGLLAEHLASTPTAFLAVDDATWKKRSGRGPGEVREAADRKADPMYNEWIEAEDKGRKKTCSSASFTTYLAATLGRADMLLSRLLHPMRSVHKWREAKTRMSAIARLADRIWSTTAAERRVRADTRTSPPKRLVVLGDGCFSGGFPKKTFARELGMRGPTLIADEFATSKECPCGLCKLQDVPASERPAPLDASRRPRRHTGSDGPDIPHCCAIKPFSDRGLETDRDELACMNILHCAAVGLKRRLPTRPEHLCSEIWRKRLFLAA